MSNTQLLIGIGLMVLIIILSFVIRGGQDAIFDGTFNMITGSLWIYALLGIIGLFVPKVKSLISICRIKL